MEWTATPSSGLANQGMAQIPLSGTACTPAVREPAWRRRRASRAGDQPAVPIRRFYRARWPFHKFAASRLATGGVGRHDVLQGRPVAPARRATMPRPFASVVALAD